MNIEEKYVMNYLRLLPQDKACPVPLNQPTCSTTVHAYWRPCFSILSHTQKPSLPRQPPCRHQPRKNSDLNAFMPIVP